jgi:hypothetical protein
VLPSGPAIQRRALFKARTDLSPRMPVRFPSAILCG